MGRYEEKRIRMKGSLQSPPFNFPPGLAHVVASVAEPRSDGSNENAMMGKVVEQHRERLISELEEAIPESSSGETGLRRFGGRVEHVVEQAAERLRLVAEEYGAEEIVERLDKLEQERRFGVSMSASVRTAPEIGIDPEAIPRSSVSGRRIGVWR